ncbi:hypothetical protein F5882DRAFT_486668 [Hyaloscypha sp. PMI_1271]|nr:hypothetical protein F5882DRAFT_486668 [Hyaloscypha sp. PMI_1271]
MRFSRPWQTVADMPRTWLRRAHRWWMAAALPAKNLEARVPEHEDSNLNSTPDQRLASTVFPSITSNAHHPHSAIQWKVAESPTAHLPPPRPTSLVLTDQLLAVAAAEATPDHCWSTALLNQANNRVNRGRPAPMAPDLSITAQTITSEQLLCYLLLAKAR